MKHYDGLFWLAASVSLAACSSSSSSGSDLGSMNSSAGQPSGGHSSASAGAGGTAGSASGGALNGASGGAGNSSGGAPSSGGAGAAGASGASIGGAGQSGNGGHGGNGPLVCPTSAPFDAEASGIREQCTRKVYVAAGQAIRRTVAFDTATNFGHDVLDPQDGTGQDEHAISSVAIARGLIVATGDGGALTSTDGITWKTIGSLPSRIHGSVVIYALDRFIIVSGNGAWTSTDAVTWTGAQNQELLPGNVPASFTGHVHAGAAGAGKVVFAGDNSVLRVFDGAIWKDAKVGDYNGWLSNLAFGADRFVVTGDACCNAAAPTSEGLSGTSSDGLAWSNVVTNAAAGVTARRFGTLLWAGTGFYATGTQYGTTGYTSPDGKTWTEVKLDHAVGPAAYYEGEYFGANDTTLYTSHDGLGWTLAHSGASGDYSLNTVAIGRILKP